MANATDCIEIRRVRGVSEHTFTWARIDKDGRLVIQSRLNFGSIADAARSAMSMNKDIPKKKFKVERGLRP